MGAFSTTGYTYISSTTASGNIVATDVSNWGGYAVSGSAYLNSGGFYSNVKLSVEGILKNVRKWAEDFCEKSPHFDKSLKNFSAIASRVLYKQLLDEGYDAHHLEFGYIYNQYCSHAFVIYRQYDTYILDVCADLFGEDPLIKHRIADIHPDSEPWWDTSISYASESGLLSRQRKDGWPEHQITLSAAKKKPKAAIKLIDSGFTDLEANSIRICPPDKEAISYLSKIAKNDGLKTNLAALLLNSDPKIADLARQLAKKLG